MQGRIRLKLALGASALAIGAVPASAAEYEFTLHHMLSEQSAAHTEMLVPWAERVEELSDGQVSIEIYPSMTLGGSPPELVSQARDGVVDIVWTVNGYTSGLHPRSEVMELPNVFQNDARAANLALYDMFDVHLAEDYRGLEVMWLHTHGGMAFQMADTEVREPADVDGLDLRTPNRVGAYTIEELGANPVSIPVPELPQALQRGTVDGALIPFEIIPPLQLQEQTQYQVEGHGGFRFGTAMFNVSMNQARWDGLPEDIQDAFREASNRDWWGEVGEIWMGTEQWGIDIATDAGNEHIQLSEEETQAFVDALEPVVERWIADMEGEGIDGAALVDRAMELIEANTD